MKVLITGAGGFIGKNLTAKLNEKEEIIKQMPSAFGARPCKADVNTVFPFGFAEHVDTEEDIGVDEFSVAERAVDFGIAEVNRCRSAAVTDFRVCN